MPYSRIVLQGFYNPQKEYALLSQIPRPVCLTCVDPQSNMCRPICPGHVEWQSGGNTKKRRCYIKNTGRHQPQLAQLVLWRKVDRERKRVWYQVSINGASGPATTALATLIVNERHRKAAFRAGENEEKTKDGDQTILDLPLSILQERVRKKIIDRFKEKINGETNDKMKYAAILYISTVLYRYFLPFLSLEDEQKLCNGMRYFLASLCSSDVISDDRGTDRNTMINAIVDKFKEIIESFKGVEAFYQVDVLLNEENSRDSRTIWGIQELKCKVDGDKITSTCEEQLLNCLFYPDDSKVQDKNRKSRRSKLIPKKIYLLNNSGDIFEEKQYQIEVYRK